MKVHRHKTHRTSYVSYVNTVQQGAAALTAAKHMGVSATGTFQSEVASTSVPLEPQSNHGSSVGWNQVDQIPNTAVHQDELKAQLAVRFPHVIRMIA